MKLYGHTFTSDDKHHNFIDEMVKPSSPYIFSIFGKADSLAIETSSTHNFYDLEVSVVFDKVFIRNLSSETLLLSLSNGKYCSINNFDEQKGSFYAKPNMFEISNSWFIVIKPYDVISFFYVTYGTEMEIQTRPLYSDPVCYDPVSDKEYVIPNGVLSNITDKYITLRFFTVITTKYTLSDDELNEKVWFVDGIQNTELDVGMHRVNVFISPGTSVDLSNFIFVPPNCIAEYPEVAYTPQSIKGNILYRIQLPSQYDFVNIYVNDVEVQSVRIGYAVYFKTPSTFTKITLNAERASKILTLTDIYQSDYIVDVEYSIPFNFINIHGVDKGLGTTNKILNYNFAKNEITVELDITGFVSAIYPGEYFMISGTTENGTMVKDAQFKITSIDTTDPENTVIIGKRV
ncbi:hypothetical protein HNP86_001908 [Methanococcus maripaludis]|uniref:Uncharacterized protein n=1 Tax=Methanococcus maripaludis TaxID=39152 RepID=A0A7J9NVP5_METMI|nr:hypothetical protein [Methanococcus maripaludis]MBA2851749.1 hypothetical protein [Methanococcus maripaludis]